MGKSNAYTQCPNEIIQNSKKKLKYFKLRLFKVLRYMKKEKFPGNDRIIVELRELRNRIIQKLIYINHVSLYLIFVNFILLFGKNIVETEKMINGLKQESET